MLRFFEHVTADAADGGAGLFGLRGLGFGTRFPVVPNWVHEV